MKRHQFQSISNARKHQPLFSMALSALLAFTLIFCMCPIAQPSTAYAEDSLSVNAAPAITITHTALQVGSPVTFTVIPENLPEGHTAKYKFLSMQLSYDGYYYAYEAEFRNPPLLDQGTFDFTFVCNGSYRLQFASYEYDEKGAFVQVLQYNGSVNPRYAFKVNDPSAQTVEQYVDGLVSEAKAKFASSATPQYDMALWFHDIITESPYDNSLSYAGPAGVLLRKTGTCESYHRALEMFFKRVGIENNRAEGGGHVWTRCKLDGEWTMLDATWDACQSTSILDLRHLYFGCTDSMISNSHVGHSVDPNSQCTGYANNYFIKSGKVNQWADLQKAAINEKLAQGETEFDLPCLGPTYAITDRCIVGEATAYVLSTTDWNDDYSINVQLEKTGTTTVVFHVQAIPKKKLVLQYRGHVQNIGWQKNATGGDWINEGAIAGTEGYGLRVEALDMQLKNRTGISGGIKYRSHVENDGWQEYNELYTSEDSSSDFVKAPKIMGTEGRGLRVEAIELSLTGELAETYSIYYCAHAQDVGWTTWVKDGAMAGTAGMGKRLEAIRVVIVEKNSKGEEAIKAEIAASKTPGAIDATDKGLEGAITYNAKMHVQDKGDIDFKDNRGSANLGTTGESKRVEAITLSSLSPNVSVEYNTHIQDIGWEHDVEGMGWRTAGQMSGTSAQSKRLEAIQIRLTGNDASKYDVYYRTHIQNIGWTGWAKNGQECGSAGYAYRMEAMQIVFVEKGGAAPGVNSNYFYQR